MGHPIMFRDDDAGLAEVREIALGFPGAFEKISWGRPVFCAPKMFAIYGGSVKGDVKGQYVQYPHSVLVKVDDSDRRALEQDERFFFPAYLGPFGWLGLDLTAAEVDWDEVAELVDSSFRLVAPKKSIKLLDERRPSGQLSQAPSPKSTSPPPASTTTSSRVCPTPRPTASP